VVRFDSKLRRSPEAPLPLEAIRDLIGICRALYAASKADGTTASDLDHLRYIGAMLTEAYRLGHGARPHTKRYDTAWTKAEDGVAALGGYIQREVTLRPAIDAAGKRITGETPPGPEWPDRATERVKRG
jgi:hypothetical protein